MKIKALKSRHIPKYGNVIPDREYEMSYELAQQAIKQGWGAKVEPKRQKPPQPLTEPNSNTAKKEE